MSDQPVPVGERYVLTLLQSSSCFAYGKKSLVCSIPPCACAQSLLDEIGKPLLVEIERLRAALKPFVRVAAILDALPRTLPDNTALRDVMPGSWPTVADVRMARSALDGEKG